MFCNKFLLPRGLTPISQILPANLQKRTTFILKRKWQEPLRKKGYGRRDLRAKNFVYDLVEDTLVKKQKNLSVTLTQYVESVGGQGEVISAKPNAAYNKLILPGYAKYTDAQQTTEKKDIDYAEHSSPFAQRTINMLNRIILGVVMNKDVPWVLEPWHIRVSLRKVGFYCDDSCITLPSTPIKGPDLDIENKDFYVTITINNKEQTELKCRIHHWSTDPSNRLPYVFEHWKQESEPLNVPSDKV